MKKFLLLICLTAFIYSAKSQTTYYWVGGATPVSFTVNSNWNTALNGSGTTRPAPTAADTSDIFIISGLNIGGATVTTGTVTATMTSNKIGQLKLQDNALVVFKRPTGGGGTGTLTITGGTGDDFVVSQGSSLTLNSSSADGNVVISISAISNGVVAGNVTMSNTGSHRISPLAVGGLVFTSTAVCTVSTTPASSAYPFGGSVSQTVANGVVFQSGSQLVYSGKYSPQGSSSAFQVIDFQPGSNYYIRASNAASTGAWTSLKSFANVYIQNGATLTADGSINKIENLTIDAGCSFIGHTSGQTPVLGNLVVNGSLAAPVGSTNGLIMGGSSSQTISGTGLISMPTFVVCANSDVELQNNVTVLTSTNIVGKLNFGASKTINGTGTFTSRVNGSAAAVTGNLTAGSYQITGVVGTLSGNTGLTVLGAGLDPNTSIVGFSSSAAFFNLSKPSPVTATNVPLTFLSDAATLTTANPNGFDSLTGCVTVTGVKSFGSGTNYVINAATTYPIGISSVVTTTMIVGNLTLNAAATTNYNTRVNKTLTLNAGKFTIRATDTVRVLSGNDIVGSTFDNSKYIVTATNGSNVGVLRIDTFNTVKAFPVGTATNYLPVKLTPTDFSNFCVSVFQGVTNDATPAGTAFSGGQKASVVDAVWLINRTKGTGASNVDLYWANGLEGSDFTNYADNQIGISRYDGTNWTTAAALAANNTANFANDTFSVFSAFGVGKLGAILPVKLANLNASTNNNSVNVSWDALNEINIKKYTIERSIDARNFVAVGSIVASNNSRENKYHFTDASVFAGTYIYRIAIVDKNGKIQYSQLLKVALQTKFSVSVYPNPANNEVVVSGISKGSTLQVVDISGKIFTQQIINNQAQILDISTLSKGMWFVRVTQLDGTVSNISFIKN